MLLFSNAEITSYKAVRDLLIDKVSLNVSPDALLLLSLSLPAKSTNCINPSQIFIVYIACDLDDYELLSVNLVTLRVPAS